MTIYYVDSSSQGGNGLAPTAAINNLAAVNALQLNPGDSVLFKAGSSFTGSTPWTGILTISAHGTESNPITFGAYGSGAAPTFANTDTNWSSSVALNGASYVVVNGLNVTNGMQAGVSTDATTNHVTLENMNISNAGTGIVLNGSNNSVLNNSIHDLKMVVNTPTNINNNDDFGANGLIISGTGHTISGNQIDRASAASYDYGSDGGGFEFWQNASNIHIFNNVVTNSVGFMEMGSQSGSFSNIEIDHNVSYNSGDFTDIHNGGGAFGSTISNIVVHDNTIANTNNAPGGLSTVWLDAPVTQQQFKFYNNIVSLNKGDSVFEQHGDYHYNNLINLQSSATHLYNNWDMSLNSGESYGAPAFADLTTGNLHIAAGGQGANLGAFDTSSSTSTPSAPAPTDASSTATAPLSTQAPAIVSSSGAVSSPDANFAASSAQTSLVALNVGHLHGAVLNVSDLVSTTGAPGEIKFVDWWNTPGAGHFELNGVIQPKDVELTIAFDQLSSLHYVVGSSGSAGQDTVQFQASNDGGSHWGTNGTDWGWATVSIIPL